MDKRWNSLKLLLTLTTMVALVVTFTQSPPQAHAQTLPSSMHILKTASSSPPLVTLPAHCFVTLVHADKTGQPIAECKVPGKMVNGRMVANVPSGTADRTIPFITQVDCGGFGGYDSRINSKTAGSICFGWPGYMGLNPVITQVTQVCGAKDSGWVRYYKNGGPGTNWYFNSWQCESAPIFDGGAVEVTQMDLN